MKHALHRALALTMALVFASASPAFAGVLIQDVHVNGSVPFVQIPDGTYRPAQADASGNMAISGSITASLAVFTPGNTFANRTVSTSSANVALPAGAVVEITNDGAADVQYRLSIGASTALTTDKTLKSGATVCLTVASFTFINAITVTGTSNLNMQGGSGGCAGYGGGGSGGSGGAVTNAGTFAVQPAGSVAHDGVGTGVNPVLNGGYASAAAPSDVSADGDAVREWKLRNGATATVITAAGALVGGDAANGLDVDVTRLPALVAGSAIIGKVGIDQTTPGTTNGVYVTNNGSAQGAAIAGQTPSTIACQNLTAAPTAYTTATTNVPTCDVYGSQIVQPYSIAAGLVKGTTPAMTGTTSTSLIAAPGSGLKNYITTLSCVNSHATVGTFVTVQDGSGGTAIWTVAAAALFGGTAITFPAPLQQPTANTALYVADVTTGANVICSASGFKAP